MKLLSREEFKRQVFERDGHRCVFCHKPAVDAHHILDRKLFPDGGYYLANGASVCEGCHWLCETTAVSVEAVRSAARISEKVLPAGFSSDEIYDKWGNVVISDHQRAPGPLFNDSGVQKILKESGRIRLFW